MKNHLISTNSIAHIPENRLELYSVWPIIDIQNIYLI